MELEVKQEFHQYPEVTAHHKDKAAAWSRAGVCDSAWSHMRTTRTGVVIRLGSGRNFLPLSQKAVP